VVPGTIEVRWLVLVIRRSAVGVNGSLSVAELFPGIGSAVPSGGVTVTVLLNVPRAAGFTMPVVT